MENYYLGNGRRWKYINKTYSSRENVFKELHELIDNLLVQRGLCNPDDIQSFLEPSLDNLHDPFLLGGMNDAVDRILLAIRKKQKILIYGDYDADGVSATSILIRFFKSLNIQIDFYIPDRVDEGYGISDAAIEYISSHEYDLVITVDCGISAKYQVAEIVEKCSKRGKAIDVIITDHHQCNENLIPDALAIINPHLPNSDYPYKNLCGAGVALKLIHALGIRTGNVKAYEEYLDIAAIATIADIVDLTGENRIITKFGIEKILNNPCNGIKALINVALANKTQIDSYRVSFILAPRINAAGRMGDASMAVKLFTTDDIAEANEYAIYLNSSNIKRQEVQEEIFKEAVNIIESDSRYLKEKIIVVHYESWHHGVIGIVASKLVDRYHKPAVVFSADEGKAVGSARSIEGFNLFKAMESQSEILIKYGGHEQAGGLSLSVQNLELFREQINEYANNMITDEMLIPETDIDIEVNGNDINLNIAKRISHMEPFGSGNKMPVFCYRGAIIREKKVIGNGKHLKLTFEIEEKNIGGVYFGKGYLDMGISLMDKVDIVFTQEINNFKGIEDLQIKLLDMRLAEEVLKKNRLLLKATHNVESLDCDENWLYNGIIDKIIEYDDIIVDRDMLAFIYKYITKKGDITFTSSDLFVYAGIIKKETGINVNAYKILVAFLIFDELGLLKLILNEDGKYTIILSDKVKKVNLEDSEILGRVNNMMHNLK